MKKVNLPGWALLAALWLTFCPDIYAEKVNGLFVESPQLTTCFYLGKHPVWTPGSENHTILYDDQEYVIPNTLDTQIRLGYDQATALALLTTDKTVVKFIGNTITVISADKSVDLIITNVAGQSLLSGHIAPRSSYEFSLDSFAAGLYVISVGDQTFKYIKR